MCFVSCYSGQWFYDFIIFLLHINNSALDPRACFSKVLLTKSKAVLFSFKIGVPKENENYEPRIDTTKILRPPPPLSFYTIIMTSLFYFLSEFYSKSWCKRSTEIIIYTVCLFYSTICCWTKREKLSVVWSVNYLPPIQNWVVSLRFEVQRNLGFVEAYNPKLSSSFLAGSILLPSNWQDPR